MMLEHGAPPCQNSAIYPLYFQSQNQKARPLNSPQLSKCFSTSFGVTGLPSYHSLETNFNAHESIGMKSVRPIISSRFAAAYGPTPLIVSSCFRSSGVGSSLVLRHSRSNAPDATCTARL